MYLFYMYCKIHYKSKIGDILKSDFFSNHTQFSKFLCEIHFKTLQ